MEAGQTAFQADNKLYALASNTAFNLCCSWLDHNGHALAAVELAAFLNSSHDTINIDSEKQKHISPPTLSIKSASYFGYTGSECTNCGSMAMVRNGNCEKCNDCGTTTGCS